MASRFPNPARITFFDVETGGPLKSRSGRFDARQFFRSSADKTAAWLSTPEATFHANNPILQLHATNVPYFNGEFNRLGEAPLNTFIKPPARDWIWENGERVSMRLSPWAVEHKLAFGGAQQTEEEALHHFFEGLEANVARMPEGLKYYLSGWNIGYDIGAVERASRRYASLSKYHGWMSDMYSAGRLDVVEASDVMMSTVLEYGRWNPEFAERYLRLETGRTATSIEDLHRVGGWKLGSVAEAMGSDVAQGIRTEDLHQAFVDNPLTQRTYQKWLDAYNAIEDYHGQKPDFERVFADAGLLEREMDAETLLKRIYRNPRLDRKLGYLSQDAVKLTEPGIEAVNWKRFGAGVALVGAAAAATGLAFSRRRDRQTQITGLSDKGIAASKRHEHTDFGSGWRGLRDQDRINWQRAALAGSLYGGYRLTMAGDPQLAFKYVRDVEDFFADSHGRNILNVFGLSQWSASYLPEDLTLQAKDLLAEDGSLNDFGQHLERLLGKDADLANRAKNGLRFQKTSNWSAYHTLEGTDYQVRFVGIDKNAPGSRWAGASQRWKKPLEESRYAPPEPHGDAWQRYRQWFRQRRSSRFPQNPKYGPVVEDLKFQPLFGRKSGAWWESFKQRAGILSLEMMERPQRLFSRIGLGAKAGTWNSAAGLGKKLLIGTVGLGLAGVGLDYADYLTGHKVSTGIASVVPKARIAHAELTDRIPGWRKTTDWYAEHVPGQWYGPAMLAPIGWAFGKGIAKAVTSKWITPGMEKGTVKAISSKYGRIGLVAGLVAAVPFLPGMLGSRQTAGELRAVYSGEEPVAVRSGRWWDIGSTPWSGRRISMYRPSWFARLQARPERVSLWGSEKEYWSHHWLLHPLKWLRNPYALEEHTERSRPYPMASPALSNIPLIGPLLAATIGRLLKPPKRMHEAEWDGTDYTLFSPRVEPKGPNALAPAVPREEFRSLGEIARREGEIAAEWVGAPGWIAKTLKNKFVNGKTPGQEVFWEGSRQMTSLSRRYYDQEAGAGAAPAPDFEDHETYSEPFRRFVQRDLKTLQANEIPNDMPRWLPGEEYMRNFKVGDPYRKVESGSSRLPGPGYEALHPELQGVPYDEYPLMERFKILSDVAPWSTQWFQHKSMLDSSTRDDTEARIEYEKILARAEELKDSSEEFAKRRYSAPTEEIQGTVKSAGIHGIELAEMPGRKFTLSALGMKAADLSSVVLGEQNRLTRGQVAREVDSRRGRLEDKLSGLVGNGVRLVVARGTAEHATEAQAVVFAGGKNFNQQLLDAGLARKDAADAGPEFQAMSGIAGRTLGKLAEGTSFEGDSSYLNPMHWVAAPKHSKLWQERTWLEQYKHHEIYGSRMQRWETPLKSFISPWTRGLVYRVTGTAVVPGKIEKRRDLDTLTDYLEYLRGLNSYTNKGGRTAVGANLFGAETFLRSTLSGRDKYYFEAALAETDSRVRQEAMAVLPADFARTLQAQWIKRDMDVVRAEGKPVPEVAEGGRLKTEEEYDAYESARDTGETRLNFGDWERSKEVARFFFRRNIRLPDSPDSPAYDPHIDYEDVKAKIVEQEGMDMHDFNLFDDRAATLWRKPYIDGAIRELTEGNDRSVEQLRSAVEQMIVAKNSRRPDVRATSQSKLKGRRNISVTVDERPDREILDDVRRHPDAYQEGGE